MRRITIAFLNKQIENVAADMKEATGVNVQLTLEQGNQYVSWKVCAGTRGSRTLISAKSKNELSERLYAAQSLLCYATQVKRENAQ